MLTECPMIRRCVASVASYWTSSKDSLCVRRSSRVWLTDRPREMPSRVARMDGVAGMVSTGKKKEKSARGGVPKKEGCVGFRV